VLADLAGGDWPERARQAAVALSASAHDNSPAGSLLLDIWLLFIQAHQDRLFTKTLVSQLNTLEDRPWRELLKDKPVTERWLAQQLHPYGVRPKTMWIADKMAKGYSQDDLSDAFKRYIPKAELDALLEAARIAQQKPPPPPPSGSQV
jgi:hypothetical protein